MITDLPYFLTVDGIKREIYCDFRDVIQIMVAWNETEYTEQEKTFITLNNLYVDDFTEFEDIDEAIEQAMWFLDGGKKYKQNNEAPRLLDWEKDYSMICSAVSKNIKTAEDIRELPFLHWWTFLGLFTERGECQLSTVLTIREKLAKGKKLDNFEKEILRESRDIIEIKDNKYDDFESVIFGNGE